MVTRWRRHHLWPKVQTSLAGVDFSPTLEDFSPTLADFSPTLHISLLRWRVSLLPSTFLSYPPHISPTLADFSPTLHFSLLHCTSLLRWQIGEKYDRRRESASTVLYLSATAVETHLKLRPTAQVTNRWLLYRVDVSWMQHQCIIDEIVRSTGISF